MQLQNIYNVLSVYFVKNHLNFWSEIFFILKLKLFFFYTYKVSSENYKLIILITLVVLMSKYRH